MECEVERLHFLHNHQQPDNRSHPDMDTHYTSQEDDGNIGVVTTSFSCHTCADGNNGDVGNDDVEDGGGNGGNSNYDDGYHITGYSTITDEL